MQVGIIVPIKYLNLSTTKLHLCYATLLSSKAYLNFYKDKEGTIILDYSPSLPRRQDLGRLLAGIKLVQPSYVVLPSVDYSSSRTISLVKDFLRLSKFKQLVGVVQGLDLDTLRECYNFLRNYCSIIGLPSPLEKIAKRDEIIRDLAIKEKVLYLEVYSNPFEEMPPTNSFGICTSFPVRLAANLRKLVEYFPTPSPLDFYKGNLVEGLVKANIEGYIELVKHSTK